MVLNPIANQLPPTTASRPRPHLHQLRGCHRHPLLVFALLFASVAALDNGVGMTPPMGYNSWYDVGCSHAMNESTIRETAMAMVRLGLYDVGYHYVNLDDCFVASRTDGKLVPDAMRFPSGMRSLSDFLHNETKSPDGKYINVAKMKFGVYTDRGNRTCGNRPASLGHESVDATTYADEWKIDYLKEDSCHAPDDPTHAVTEYGVMRDALNKSGRAVYFSLCGWHNWYAPIGASLGNSWRIGPDDGSRSDSWEKVLKNIDLAAPLAEYAGPGKGWNDPCLLLSKSYDGTPLLTELQSRAQFSMWAVLAAPLLISGSILHMSPTTLETYSNNLVLAVSQDKLGKQGIRLSGGNLSQCLLEPCTNVWFRPLSGQPGRGAMVFLNAGPNKATIVCDAACWKKAGMSQTDFPMEATDLWTRSPIDDIGSPYYETTLDGNGGFTMIEVMTIPKTSSLPHLRIPQCPDFALAQDFKVDSVPRPYPLAIQQTTVKVCHDVIGIHVRSNATDENIFSASKDCNDPVFSQGDVAEVFIAPVEKIEDSPSFYLEVDTSATGVIWASVIHNGRNMRGLNIGGNASGGVNAKTIAASDDCSPGSNFSNGCLMKCMGKANFPHGMTVTVDRGAGWWADHLVMPWSVFPSPLIAKGSPGKPWPLWRLNFYRYDYWRKTPNGSFDDKNEELSAWSASGAANFHVPQFFGVAQMV